jgi:hypothetical protein
MLALRASTAPAYIRKIQKSKIQISKFKIQISKIENSKIQKLKGATPFKV